MVQVHTLYEASAWRNRVDGLQQGVAHPTRSVAVSAGRNIASDLGARHYVHDVDGVVLEQHVYDRQESGRVGAESGWVGAMVYTA